MSETISSTQLIGLLLDMQNQTLESINASDKPADLLQLEFLGSKSEFSRLSRQIKDVPNDERQQVGVVINEVKRTIEDALNSKTSPNISRLSLESNWVDVTAPGARPPDGHLHLVTQAIMEITRIFERIGFTRVRHPEVDTDYYAFESLNMPPNHPARDEWETFFIESSLSSRSANRRSGDLSSLAGIASPRKAGPRNDKSSKIVLTPHTSNGQVREMEKGKLPIRMINIAKCYRRQSDVSHTAMFHQFEGLYVDKNVSIGDLKGVMDYFFTQYYGPGRKSRLRPFHFQFTEPSFEVDVTCGVCLGKGCKLCKDGWLELGGAGMVHPNVLKYGKIDPTIYSGFAFGWGIERVVTMKTQGIDDIRLLYGNDVRFLEQF